MQVGVRAPIFSATGYAELSRNVVKSFLELGVDVVLDPIDVRGETPLSEKEHQLFLSLCSPLEPTMPVFNIGVPPSFDFYNGKPRVGFTLTEGLRLPPDWAPLLNCMDKVVTVSSFGRQVFIASGVLPEKLCTVSPVVSPKFHPEVTPLYCESIRPFVVLFVGQLIFRKGWDKLLLGAIRAFSKVDDVCILLKVSPTRSRDKILKELEPYRSMKGKLPILVHTGVLALDDIPKLYQVPRKLLSGRLYRYIPQGRVRGVFALPSLGEGIGLPYLEAMASGLLTLGTSVTGHADFISPETAIVIPAKAPRRHLEIETQLALYRFEPFYDVAEEDVAEALWRAYTMKETEREQITLTALKMARSYTFERMAEELLSLL